MDLFPTLPNDVIAHHILVRLPPKSLVRFLAVSKTWFSSITDPTFIGLHLRHVESSTPHAKSHMLLTPFEYAPRRPEHGTCILLSESNLEEVKLGFPKQVMDARGHALVGSVNGLVCFTMWGGFYIWNPFIRTGMTIPPSPLGPELMLSCYFQCLGFGFDPVTSDYKLILIPLCVFPAHLPLDFVTRCEIKDKRIHVYSLSMGLWKQVRYPFEFLEDFVYEDALGISSGGSIYWLVHTKGLNRIKKIASFNLEQECFLNIMLPNYKIEVPDDDDVSIQVIKDSVHLLVAPRGWSDCHMWMLKENCKTNVRSWTKLCKVVFPGGSLLVSEKHFGRFAGLSVDGWIWMTTFDPESSYQSSEAHHYLLYDSKNKSFLFSKKSGSCFACTCLTESLIGLAHWGRHTGSNYENLCSFEDSMKVEVELQGQFTKKRTRKIGLNFIIKSMKEKFIASLQDNS